jgi:hypothetical protein
VRGLVSKGVRFAQQRCPALKTVTQLARGNLKGALLPLAKTALGTVVPGGPAALSVLQGLGFETAEDAAQNPFGWQNYRRMAREAYENLADTVTTRVNEPREASQLAANASRRRCARLRRVPRARRGSCARARARPAAG